MKLKKRYLFISAIIALGVLLFSGVIYEWDEIEDWWQGNNQRSWEEIVESGTLKVGTIQSSISAFQYKGRWRGYEYETAAQVASELGLQLELHLAKSEKEMLDSLRNGYFDLAAWPVSHRLMKYEEGFRPCGYQYEMDYRTFSGKTLRIKEGDSAKYHLAIVEESRPWFLLSDTAFTNHFPLKPFVIDTLQPENVQPEVLVEQITKGKYDLTLVASNVGHLLQKYYDTAIVGAPLEGSIDSVSWMVSVYSPELAQKIDSVCRFGYEAPVFNTNVKRQFQVSKMLNGELPKVRRKSDGSLTGYDALFKEYADSVGWDWHLLAALAMHESNFKPDLVSSKGATGIMQVMPHVAKKLGCPEDSLMNVRYNIRTASRLIQVYERRLRKRIAVAKEPTLEHYSEADSTLKAEVEKDLVWFVLASYNAGLGHVYDAIAMSEALGYNPAVWEHNVEQCLKLKLLPEYYNMPCVRLGKFNAMLTMRYVREVIDMGEHLKTLEKAPAEKKKE